LLEACLYKPPFAQNWNYNIVDCQYTQNVGKGSDGKPINYIIICLSSDDRSQINLFSSYNNEKFSYVSFIFFIYGSLNFSRGNELHIQTELDRQPE
jgi:hypothetical protein